MSASRVDIVSVALLAAGLGGRDHRLGRRVGRGADGAGGVEAPAGDAEAAQGRGVVDRRLDLVGERGAAQAELAATSAAVPATYGEAIEVPSRYWYVDVGYVERIAWPGAKRSTVLAP